MTILQVKKPEAQLNDETDGLAIGCLILWIPSFIINFLHLRNIRMQKKCINVPNLPMPLSGSLINEIEDQGNKGNLTLYEQMLIKTQPE